MTVLHLADPAATHALGASLGHRLFPGARLLLVGDLGAGKTALVRGLAAGLGCPSRIQSPTFGLVQSHEGGALPLWHADWYRLAHAEEARALALFELAEGGVTALEWADRFPELWPAERLVVTLSEEGEGRRAELHGQGDAHVALERLDG